MELKLVDSSWSTPLITAVLFLTTFGLTAMSFVSPSTLLVKLGKSLTGALWILASILRTVFFMAVVQFCLNNMRCRQQNGRNTFWYIDRLGCYETERYIYLGFGLITMINLFIMNYRYMMIEHNTPRSNTHTAPNWIATISYELEAALDVTRLFFVIPITFLTSRDERYIGISLLFFSCHFPVITLLRYKVYERFQGFRFAFTSSVAVLLSIYIAFIIVLIDRESWISIGVGFPLLFIICFVIWSKSEDILAFKLRTFFKKRMIVGKHGSHLDLSRHFKGAGKALSKYIASNTNPVEADGGGEGGRSSDHTGTVRGGSSGSSAGRVSTTTARERDSTTVGGSGSKYLTTPNNTGSNSPQTSMKGGAAGLHGGHHRRGRSVDVSHNALDEGMLLESMRSNQQLYLDVEELDLSYNNIRSFSNIKTFLKGRAMKITSLVLRGNPMGDTCLKDLIGSIESMPHLEELDIGYCNLTMLAGDDIALLLRKSSSIKKISASVNSFQAFGASLIAEGLIENTSLKYIDLRWNDLQKEGVETIVEALEQRPVVTCAKLWSNNQHGGTDVHSISSTVLLYDKKIRMSHLKSIGSKWREKSKRARKPVMALNTLPGTIQEAEEEEKRDRHGDIEMGMRTPTGSLSLSKERESKSQTVPPPECPFHRKDTTGGEGESERKKRSIFEAFGEDRLQRIVDVFYDLVVSDPKLGRFFNDVKLHRMKYLQTSFMCVLFGATGKEYHGRNMAEAHATLGVTDDHFDAMMDHFFTAMRIEWPEAPSSLITESSDALEAVRRGVVQRHIETGGQALAGKIAGTLKRQSFASKSLSPSLSSGRSPSHSSLSHSDDMSPSSLSPTNPSSPTTPTSNNRKKKKRGNRRTSLLDFPEAINDMLGPSHESFLQEQLKKLGGKAYLDEVSIIIYDNIAEDPSLSLYFGQYSRMKLFFSNFLQNKVFDTTQRVYTCRALRAAHDGMSISNEEYDQFTAITLNAFMRKEAPREILEHVRVSYEMFKPYIVMKKQEM